MPDNLQSNRIHSEKKTGEFQTVFCESGKFSIFPDMAQVCFLFREFRLLCSPILMLRRSVL